MHSLFEIVGAIGVFLLGMVVMTEGLKALAGARVSRWLAEATRSPWSGAATGAFGTAILQSSSATTVAAVGFVGAGLLSFPQALGIIFGANIGTTITGWMVALLGFKLQLGSLLLPLIFVGVLLRLFAGARLAPFGYALAGFGLIFVGIDLLQQAAAQYADLVDLGGLPADSLGGRLRLVAIGIVITLLTQSSSAGVAAALVALNSEVIGLQQALALVIGMDVGTTITAAIAAVGGSTGTRRTGFSHVIYNLFTALGALALIGPFVYFWQAMQPAGAEIALVAFHSLFNVLGALLILPFAAQFARMVEKLVPDRGPRFATSLEPTLISEPGIALLAAHKVIVREFLTLLVNINFVLERADVEFRADLRALSGLLEETRVFLDRIHLQDSDSAESRRLVALIHASDHLQRLRERCEEDLDRAVNASQRPELAEVETVLDDRVDQIIAAIENNDFDAAEGLAEAGSAHIRDAEDPLRETLYREVAQGVIDVRYATESAEALRWLTRVSRHISRICHYLGEANGARTVRRGR